MNIEQEKQSYLDRKQKDIDKDKIMQEMQMERDEKIQKINSEWDKEQEEFKKMKPKEKAKKMIRTYCYLGYKGNGHKMSFDEWTSSELATKVSLKIQKYFEKNNTEHCPSDVYTSLLK